MDLMRTADQMQAREVQRRNDYWSNYKEEKSAELAEAAAKAEPLPSILPHPDDVVIDRQRGSQILGPFDETSEDRAKETIAFCETLLI